MYSGVEVLRETFHSRYDSKNWSIYILDISSKYSGKTCLSVHFLPIFIVKNLLTSPLLGFEVRGDVIFSQSGDDCPVILCPFITKGDIFYTLQHISNCGCWYTCSNWLPDSFIYVSIYCIKFSAENLPTFYNWIRIVTMSQWDLI